MNSFPNHLLLIDADESDVQLVRSMLGGMEDARFKLEWASSYEAGLKALTQPDQHDVCLLDYRVNGLALLRQAQEHGCRIPIILLAPPADRQSGIEALRAGAVDYLFKESMDAPLLERSLRYAGERRRTADELAKFRDELERRVAERTAELTRANTSLAESDRRKDEFLAVLAHELRNPLAALAAATELLTLKDADPETRERIPGVLQRQIRQLSRLIDDLMDVARIMRGKIQLHKMSMNLKDILAQAIETTHPMLNARRQSLHLTMPDHPLTVLGDATRLTQVFTNLLNNAAKFTHEGGHVWITVETSGITAEGQPAREVRVRIRDNGVGMAADAVPHIFDPFVQAIVTVERTRGGLGVGLTLVKRLVELHGGTVWARSAGPGQGSEFVVSLLLPGQTRPATDPPPTEPPRASLPSRRLLLVDDNIDTAESLARLLRHLGQEVLAVHDGSSALDAAPGFQPEIVLLDIGLPGLDGYEVAQRLRQQPGMDKAVLIALTGYSHEEDRNRCINAGFNYHLVKPARLKTLEKLLLNPRSFSDESAMR